MERHPKQRHAWYNLCMKSHSTHPPFSNCFWRSSNLSEDVYMLTVKRGCTTSAVSLSLCLQNKPWTIFVVSRLQCRSSRRVGVWGCFRPVAGSSARASGCASHAMLVGGVGRKCIEGGELCGHCLWRRRCRCWCQCGGECGSRSGSAAEVHGQKRARCVRGASAAPQVRAAHY